ncbi:MAG: formate dehydrogenase subunit delta [Pseudomonadota bacterium]|nr:formate dehydrogenase subunit delta [Pseudomonadota bacterium]
MDADNLIHMANRIAEFFEAMDDRQEAVDGVALHLRRYWEPRMRTALHMHVQAHGPQGLHALVSDALKTMSAASPASAGGRQG